MPIRSSMMEEKEEDTDSLSDIQDESEILSSGRFGVPWLDAWFSAALQEDALGDVFFLVSEELGHLMVGQYRAGSQYSALLGLLGPGFVGRHLPQQADMRALEKGDVRRDSIKWAATYRKVQEELIKQGDRAMAGR